MQDANGVTLDTRTISNFNGGQYLVWKVSGHVRLVVSWVAGPNAVVSGLFFDTATGGGGGGSTLTTTYTYDLLDHLTQVSMPRSTGTQTRTFNYSNGSNIGPYLLSATNPENGTVSYSYNSTGQVVSKTDAKGQRVVYSYDQSLRLTQVQRYLAPGNVEDICERATYYYDTNPFNSTFSQYSANRPGAVQYGATNCQAPYQFTEMYSYLPGGAATKKRLTVTPVNSYQPASLDTSQTYDNEGKVLTVKYPDAYITVLGTAQTGPTYTYAYDTLGRPIL